MHLTSLLLLGAVLFSSQHDVDALPQRRATTKARLTTKATTTTKASTAVKTSNAVSTTRSTTQRVETTSRAVTTSTLGSSQHSVSSRPTNSPSGTSKPPISSTAAMSSASSSSPVVSTSAVSSASSVLSNSFQPSSISSAPVASSSSSAFPSGSSVPVWRIIPTSYSIDPLLPVPTPVVDPSSQPSGITTKTDDPTLLFPSGDVSLPGVSASSLPTGTLTSDVASSSAASALAFKIRGANNVFKSLDENDGVSEHNVGQSLVRRETVNLYHGTCESSVASIRQGLRLPVPHGDEFSYKSGFYLTPDVYNAFKYARMFKACAPGERKVVITFRFNTSGLRILKLGTGKTALNFWNAQGALAYHLSRGRLPSEFVVYKERVDESDVITGTVPLAQDQIFDDGPRDPFPQAVFVSQDGLDALNYVEFAYA